jgi:hypothetical protein
MATILAVMDVVGEDYEHCFGAIQRSYNAMVQSKAKIIEAVGKSCEAWFESPRPSQFERLVELFKLLRSHIVEK